MTDAPTHAVTAPFEPPSLAEVARLFPQLEILAFIGRGGMGAVYKARQPALDRFVALKLLAPHRTDSGFAERFGREARALAKLVHPNIVAVHDFGQVEGWNYIIMEFVDGVNLRQLEHAGRLSPREALQIVPQVCDALQFAHDNGIVHRDIKPENVLMDTRGRVKIADFGIAKILERHPGDQFMTGSEEVMGTPHYMAPEQVERPQEVDHRADIYSLGVVFYELLTGELPLGKFQPPSRRVTVDVRLDEVVLRALEKAPELRYQTAADFRTGVETVVAQSAGPAGPANTQPSAEESTTLNEHLWKVVPIAAVVLAFANPWGGDAWLWFASVCAVLAVLPAIPFSESANAHHRRQLYRLVGFRTKWGQWCFSLGWLGFLGFFGFMEGWEPLLGFLGFFGFCGLAVIPEIVARRRSKSREVQPDPPARRREIARFLGFKTMVTVAVALVVALFIRTFLLQAFQAATDAAAPEIPRGSHVLVWKPTRDFSLGDLLAYKYKGYVSVGRVSGISGDQITLSHYKRQDVVVSRAAIVGKVVSVYWRGPAPAVTAAAVSTADGYEPEQIRELSADDSLKHAFLDLDKGSQPSPPAALVQALRAGRELQPGLPTVSSVRDWMRESGADMLIPARNPKEAGYCFLVDGISTALAEKSDITAVQCSFDKVSAPFVKQALDSTAAARRGEVEPLTWRFDAAIAWAFKTREGRSGVLEILETSASKIKIRYKLLKPSAASSSVDGPTQPREVVAAWLRAVKEGRNKDAWALTCNEDAGWSPSLTNLKDYDTIKPMHQLGDDVGSMVVTNPFTGDGDPPRVLLLLLKKVDGLWRIDSHAMRTPSDASLAMDGFKANPSVRYALTADEFIGDWHELGQRITLRADGAGSHQELIPVEGTDRCEWAKPTDLKWSVSGSAINVTHPQVGGKVEILHMDAKLFLGRHADGRSFSFYRDEKPTVNVQKKSPEPSANTTTITK